MKKIIKGAICAVLMLCVFTFAASASIGDKHANGKVAKVKKHTHKSKKQTGVSLLVNIRNGAGCASPYRIIVYRLDNFAVIRDVSNWTASSIRFNGLPIGIRYQVSVFTSSCSGSALSPSSGGLNQTVTVTINR
jgi:hypothetical protein